MAISKRVRYEVLRRDGNRCRYCGASATDGATLTIDHVTPVALGGSDDPTNLVAACRDCNAGKTSTNPDAPLVADVTDEALRWRAAMMLAVQQMEQEHEQLRAYREAFYDEWMSWTFTTMARTADLPGGWRSTVDRWNAAGYPIDMLIDAVHIAMSGPADRWSKFNYLCGVMKKKLTEIQNRAKELIDEQDAERHECTCIGVEPETPYQHTSEQICGAYRDGQAIGRQEFQHGLFRAFHSEPARLLDLIVDGTQPINPEMQRLIWAA